MAAAMCTLVSPDGDAYGEEGGEQFAMEATDNNISVESALPSTSTVLKDAAFVRLPGEIVELILQFTDPNSFASLILLNKKWRRISQQPQLYALQLSRCRSYSASHHEIYGPLVDADLPRLRSLFAQEVKRNLFDCYLRPRETFIKLVSTSISSSAAFPGGEAFHFSFSSNGHYVLAYSSSRIYVLDVASEEVVVKRELKILRRPSTATILDDGSILALLSTDHQVDIYDISAETPKHIRVVALDHSPRAIALSPEGSVLAIGYEGGVEVYSLAECALPTDRRAVKCDPSDHLSFSPDGTQLLGTTIHSQNPSTVILTAPYYNPVSQMPEESISQLWTTSILFPNSSRDCSHATLLPNLYENEASWTFTYDKVFESFRAVRIDDLRNGTTYFTGPETSSATRLLPSTLPAANRQGEVVASGFQGRQIWLYGVPEDLEASPEIVHNLSGNGESMISTPTSDRRASALPQEFNRTPQWQTLADRLRNTFVEGRHVADLEGAKAMTWVGERHGYHTERLVVVAPGIAEQQLDGDGEGLVPVDGGRLLLLDFQYGTSDGERQTVTIEVGNTEPQVLEEEQRDMAAEVALLRRRTIAAQRRTHLHISHLGTVAIPGLFASSESPANTKSPSHMAAEAAQRFRNLQIAHEDNVSLEDEEQAEVFDAPYSHTSPRSGNTLRRAATVAASHRRFHPRSVVPQGPVSMRRTDGTELPHESDADNWVPPPPPYSREPIEPLPEHLRNAILAGNVRTLNRSSPQPSPRPEFITLGHGDAASLYRTRSTNSLRLHQRTMSDSVTVSSSDYRDIDIPRPSSSPYPDIYGVSPPSSPRLLTTRPAEPVSPESDELSMPSPDPVSSVTAESQSRALMRATLLQPVSPIPQPIQAWERASTERRLEDWENTSDMTSAQASTINLDEPLQVLTLDRLQAPVPPRPNDDHHVMSFDDAAEHEEAETDPPTTIARPTSDTSLRLHESLSEVVSDLVQSPIFYEGGLERPSDEQIAKLNSRVGRPQILTDPSQRRSGSRSSSFETNSRRPIHSGSGSALNNDPRRTSNSSITSISEEKELSSPIGTQLPSNARGLRTTNMPPVSIDTRHRSWVPPITNPGSPLSDLCELGGSDILNGPIGNIDTVSADASELPVFAPQPTRPTYPTNAERRHSGYSTPPRLNTPPRSVSSTPPRSFSPSSHIQTENRRRQQSPIRRRPVTSYNAYSSPSLSNTNNNNRRHSGLAYEINSYSPNSNSNSNIKPFRTAGTGLSRPQSSSSPSSSSNQKSARSKSLVRLDTIRSIGAGSIDDGNTDGAKGRNVKGRDVGFGAGSIFKSWGRGRSRHLNPNSNPSPSANITPTTNTARNKSIYYSNTNANGKGKEKDRTSRRETADWGELLNASSERLAERERSVSQSRTRAFGMVMGRSRSGSREGSILDGGRGRTDRAVGKENKKRREKMGGKCVVM